MKSLLQNYCALVFTSWDFTKEIWMFSFWLLVCFLLFTVTCTFKSEMVNQLSFFFFSFRASPHGWICGVVSTKTPSSIVLCLEKIALSKECNRMVKYQNGKVYKLLTKIRASLSVLCHLTSLLWSWRWANSSWNDCVGKNHVCRIENLHVMTVLTLFKQWWDKSAVEIG